MRITKFLSFPILCAALCGIPGSASAGNFSFTGMFNNDDQMAVFQFVASASSPVISTLSYNGGTNANNVVIPAGGFLPALSLFGPDTMLQPSTALIGEGGDGTANDVTIDTSSPPITIVAGQEYWVVLTQFDNLSNGTNFGSGFKQTGNPDFTSTNGCLDGPFCDNNTLSNRTGNWAVDITGVTSAQQVVPEPATFLMLGTVFAGVLAARRWKSAARQSL
jgi:hypothetical protein